MLNHPKSLSGALTVHCSGGFYLAFNFLFVSFTWHQLSARFLFQSGAQVFTWLKTAGQLLRKLAAGIQNW
jgi:hypothetical protein